MATSLCGSEVEGADADRGAWGRVLAAACPENHDTCTAPTVAMCVPFARPCKDTRSAGRTKVSITLETIDM